MTQQRLPVVVLISGNGSNLQTFIDGQMAGELPIDIKAVVSNRADAYGLTRATSAGITAQTLPHGGYPSRDEYDRDLTALIEQHQPELVILAGFMRILTPAFVSHFAGRLINIHPSLLPAFRGLDTHERALAAGVKEHGCSVHFVTPELDAGPVIVQAKVPVLSDDTADTLAKRVQTQEHRIYPLAVRWLAEGRVEMRADGVYRDGKRQSSPPVLSAERNGQEV
ncbi:phosphoribosylglycinamide formyltransferase [Alkalilimnicola ehrlichii]|uniref:Phosphoribosylglycinamide formyltransferase n=1 Tax=Alkalilimnicola ehrlichii TaxID=351052 RepID=A0A3E0WYC9_9GAMM|nr:phosphoribosylglycinamide formyltransferase [Alkalilimnicola ehrlichii]RFA30429.1 phosphoribosylglycinamide formyltransferase [Alkalilimnicola ehrlichii]RFA37982.1 phosphoribosylglycinamide formyltransferase [Alkalilimnicola ehrlichii]